MGRLHVVPVGPLVGLLVVLVGPEGAVVVSPVGVGPWGRRLGHLEPVVVVVGPGELRLLSLLGRLGRV